MYKCEIKIKIPLRWILTLNFVSLLYIISKYNYLIHSLNQVTIIFGKDMPKNCLCPSILILSLSWPHFEQRIFPWNRKCGIWDTQCSSFIHEMCIKYQGWMYRKNYVVRKVCISTWVRQCRHNFRYIIVNILSYVSSHQSNA